MTRFSFESISSLLSIICLSGLLQAQSERHELARRLVRFEQAWEQVDDAQARQNALRGLPKVTTQFFSLQLGEAGRTLDEAWYELRKSPPTDAERWAFSFYVAPKTVLFDPLEQELSCTIRQFYKPIQPQPPSASAILEFQGHHEEVLIDKLPVRFKWKQDETQAPKIGLLNLSVRVGDTTYPVASIEVASVPKLKQTLQQYRAWAASRPASEQSIELATLRDLLDSLVRYSEDEIPESDRNLKQLLDLLPKLKQAITTKQPYYTQELAGDHSLCLPLDERRTANVRLFVPKKLQQNQQVPLVVAMHGAGGSENMFFESYGAGQIVRECEQRGWLLVATRAGLLGSPPVKEIIDALKQRYPVDSNQLFVVGHSMGAGQAAEFAQQNPTLLRGLGLLGGAARVRNLDVFAKLPLFLAVGTKDQLAYRASESLAETLRKANATDFVYKSYPEVEHLVIARVALPDLFKHWEQRLKRQ